MIPHGARLIPELMVAPMSGSGERAILTDAAATSESVDGHFLLHLDGLSDEEQTSAPERRISLGS